jgi:hypothetical protein
MQQSSIVGRRIVKSNIQLTISRQYSVTSFIHLNRLSSTMNIPFQLKQNTNLIKPQIRERIETLQKAVYRTRSFFER